MKIIIDANNETGLVNDFKIEDGTCSLDTLVAAFFGVLDGTVKDILVKSNQEAYSELYEHFTAIFDLFFQNVFPEPPEGYFELSDAALLYAQDKIIDEAVKKGMTYEEALAHYEEKAKEYVKKNAKMMA